MTETRPLTVQIPKPRECGCCDHSCSLLALCPFQKRGNCPLAKEVKDGNFLRPGKGCPWHKETRHAKA